MLLRLINLSGVNTPQVTNRILCVTKVRPTFFTASPRQRFLNLSGPRFQKLNKEKIEKLKVKLKLTRTDKELEALYKFEDELRQLSLLKKCRKIVLEYWHVFFATHFVCSAVWFSFLFGIASYFELTPAPIIEMLDKLNLPTGILKKLSEGSLGSVATTFFLYKLVALARIATTVYFSMVAIRQLMPKGIIKPKQTPEFLKKYLRFFGIKV